MTTISNKTQKTGTNTIILKTNQNPYNGTCFVDPLRGRALETIFTIECTDWIDDDGYIIFYRFIGSF